MSKLPSRKIKDARGLRSGNLEVIDIAAVRKGRTLWLCRCHVCGGTCQKSRDVLMPGTRQAVNCGCVARERAKNHTHHPLYATWREMKRRCTDTKSASYHLYGGAGVKVCERWE